MSTLAIIGTAGRGADAKLLTAAHWRMMTTIAQTVACTLDATHLVSGSSAWADHCAVDLYLAGHAKTLTLHLPARWYDWEKDHAFEMNGPGSRLNDLHAQFQSKAGVSSLAQIQQAIKRGAAAHVNERGFLARNADVAAQTAERLGSLLAFTFSGGALPSDGGTANTWTRFHEHAMDHVMQEPQEDMAGGVHYPEPLVAFHFDLVHRRLHRHVFENPRLVALRERSEAEAAARRAARPPGPPAVITPEDQARGLI